MVNNDEFRDAVNQFMGALGEFRESTEKRLDTIDRRLTEGTDAFEKIRLTCAEKEGRINSLEEGVAGLKKKDVLGGTSSTEKLLIAFASVGNALKWLFDIFS